MAVAVALAACTTAAPAATPGATTPVIATPAGTSLPSAAATVTPPATAAVTPTAATTFEASPSAEGSPSQSQAPVVTIEPGSSLDVTKSDAGVAGRVTIPDDTREVGDHFTGTHEIQGREADGSYCDYSFSGDEFIAYPQYNDAPVGMLYDMIVAVPTDDMPANDGEQRAGIQNGRVVADFHTASLLGGTYSGNSNDTNDPGTSSIDVSVSGDTYTFSFTAETWDHVAFNGQVICTGVAP